MKKLIALFTLVLFSISAYAADLYLICQILPAKVKEAKESDSVDALYTIIDGGTNIAVGSSTKKFPLMTSDQKYEWQWAVERNGTTLTMREEINRVTGEYSAYIDGPKGPLHVSNGTCRKAEQKL